MFILRVPTDRSLQLHKVVSVIQNVLGVGGALLHVVHLHAHPVTGQGFHEWPVKSRAKQLKLPVRWPIKTMAGQTTGQTAQTTRQVAHQNHGRSNHRPNSSNYLSGGPSKPWQVKLWVKNSTNYLLGGPSKPWRVKSQAHQNHQSKSRSNHLSTTHQ